MFTPEIRIGLWVWGLALVTPWIRFPAVGIPYGPFEAGVCVVFLLAFYLPNLGVPTVPLQRVGLRIRGLMLIVLGIMTAVALLSLYRSSGSAGASTLEELRHQHLSGEAGVDADQSRLFSILAPAMTMLVFEASLRARALPWLVTLGALLSMALLMAVVSFGGRYDALCLAGLALMGIVTRYSAEIAKVPKTLLWSSIAGVLVCLALTNSIYGVMRHKDGLESTLSDIFYEEGATVLRGYGISNPPLYVGLTIGMVDDYLWRTIERFGLYLKNDDLPPALGQHCFGILTRRVGFNAGPEYKQAVDDYYAQYGIFHNVWATGFREFCIDFKIAGTIIFLLGLGFLYRWCRTVLVYSWFAGMVAAMIGAAILISPFSSIFKSIYLQSGFLVGVILLLLDTLTKFAITSWMCFREPEIDELDKDEIPEAA